jgi:uncharacterized protein (TIGR03437 family)
LARSAALASLFCAAVQGQFVPLETAVPRTAKLPVVFLNGYQMECPGTTGDLASFRATFGVADEVLQRNGQVTLFFDSCSVANRPPIETLGKAFGDFLTRLRYTDGQPVTQVDIVVHSMGGLIVRSYLAGKQPDQAPGDPPVFSPPAERRVRKVVFLGTPHFGTPISDLAAEPSRDIQVQQLARGSRFVFDLATWNQGTDDLRGVDAIAVLGNAGNGTFGNVVRFHDSTTTLTSGSLDFVLPGRTRIVNFCHTGGLAEFLCSGAEGRLAAMTSDTHLSARIVMSFLNGTEEWRSIGEPANQNTFLTTRRGLVAAWRDAQDRSLAIRSASTGQIALSVRAEQIAYGDFVTAEPVQMTLTGPSGTTTVPVPASAGATRALTVKAGPLIAAVVPTFAVVFPRSVSPGMFVSIYGTDLATTTAQAPGLPYPTLLGTTEVRLNGAALPLHYAAPGQINAVMPESSNGLAKLTVKTAAGEHTVNVMIESSVPALAGSALNALTGALVTADAPLRAGDYVALFLTGLGITVRRDGLDYAAVQPEVLIGGKPCELLYAGRAPGFIGLDQINCRLASDLASSNTAPVIVRSGPRSSNTIALPVR